MSDGPQQCALPDCTEIVEQPDDGGPRRLYCSPAHRAIARKMRHAARVEPTATQPVSNGADLTQPVSAEPDRSDGPDGNDPAASEPPAALAAPSQEPAPAPEPDRDGSLAAATTVTPPAGPGRTVRVITSKRVKKQRPTRTAADIKNAAAKMRRRAVASVAIASLVAGGASYMVNENIIPTSPTLPPQSTPQPSMEADVWAGQAEVVLASLSSQLDAVAQAEAAWLALPEPRRAQEPSAVQALKDRKALLEQQRATLMSQLEALRALPELTTELSSAQAQLDAVERTLKESNAAAASPDYQEAVRQLEEQREMRRQQRDHAAQQLADLRDGVENALSAPLPAETDETRPIVERVKAVAEGRPDPAEQDNDSEHNVADGQDSAATQRREDDGEERSDTGTTAPPDPDRPSIPDVLADGARESRADAGRTSQDLGNGGAPADNGAENNAGGDTGNTAGNGGDAPRDEPAGPVSAVAGGLGGVLGGGDSDRSERDDDGGNAWSIRGNDNDRDNDRENDRNDDRDNDDDRGGLGDTVRNVGDGLFGGDRDDDRDEQRGDDRDDNDDRSNWLSGDNDRDDSDDRGDRDDSDDRSGWWSGGDRDERGDDDRDNQGDDRGGLDDLTDGLTGGSDREQDGSEDGNAGQSGEHAEDDEAADNEAGDNEDGAGSDEERKRPIGKAERERQRTEENNDSSSETSDESDEDSTSDRGNNDRGEDDDNGSGNNDDDNRGNGGNDDGNGSSDDNGSDDNDGGSDEGSDDDAGDDDGGSDDGGNNGDDDGGSDDGGDGGDDDGGDGGGDDGGDGGGDDGGDSGGDD